MLVVPALKGSIRTAEDTASNSNDTDSTEMILCVDRGSIKTVTILFRALNGPSPLR